MTYTLEQFCEDKRLPLDWVVKTFALRDGEDTFRYKDDNPGRWKKGDEFKSQGIFFPYCDGNETQYRVRVARDGKKRFIWSGYKRQMLYGLDVPPPDGADAKTIVLVEGESCCITGRMLGLFTLGIAGAPNGWDYSFKNLAPFQNAEKIYVVQERKRADLKPEDIDAGAELVRRVAACFPGKVYAIRLHALPELRNTNIKDLSDLWIESCNRTAVGSEYEFTELWNKARACALEPGKEWRDYFRDPATLQTGDIKMLIDGILPEGVTMLGSNSGVGKTWMALSMAKALITGAPYLGTFKVSEPQKVLYLVPEVGDRSLRYRLERLRIPFDGERLRVRTLADGTLRLNDPLLLDAVKEWKDENSAAENATLADALFALARAGAKSTVGLHHAPKGTANANELTLENVLRGTGDLGAMCDCVWGLQHDRGNGDEDYIDESRDLTRLLVKCVKPRDFEPAAPFRVQGRPYIDERGDFVILTDAEGPVLSSKREHAAQLVADNQRISKNQLAKKLGVSRNTVDGLLKDQWSYRELSKTSGVWERVEKPVEAEMTF